MSNDATVPPAPSPSGVATPLEPLAFVPPLRPERPPSLDQFPYGSQSPRLAPVMQPNTTNPARKGKGKTIALAATGMVAVAAIIASVIAFTGKTSAEDKAASLDRRVESLTAKNDGLHDDIDNANTENEQLVADNEQAVADNEQLEADNAELSDELATAKEELGNTKFELNMANGT